MVNKLIRKYKTRDPYELANYLDIVLIAKPLGTVIDSYFYINRTKVVFLNSSLNDYEKIVILAHEIGHAVLHLFLVILPIFLFSRQEFLTL